MNENSGYFRTIEEFLFNCITGQIYFYKFFLTEPSQHWALSAAIWNNSPAFNTFVALLQCPRSSLGPSIGFCTAEASHARNPDHGDLRSFFSAWSKKYRMLHVSWWSEQNRNYAFTSSDKSTSMQLSTGVMHQWELGIAGSFHSCKKQLKARKVKNWLS